MTKKILIVLASACVLTGCYDSYLREFDHTAAYIAYQYDLRTFVAGEEEAFNLPVALAGVMVNDRERKYSVSVDNSLCTADLLSFTENPKDLNSFTALDGLLGKAPFGELAGGSGSYVTSELSAAGLSELTALPEDCYTLSFDGLSIPEGYVTAYGRIKATDKLLADPKAYAPYYAICYRINSADVDVVVPEKSFAVVAVKVENRFFGNWYHGGKSVVGSDEVLYPFAIPQEDGKVYTLTTVNANTVKTNKIAQGSGSLTLTFNGSDITITSDDVTMVEDSRRSYFNDAKLLQDRKLYLNYSYLDAKGRTVQVSDSLVFRNRIRDGINEWQDTNKEHYK